MAPKAKHHKAAAAAAAAPVDSDVHATPTSKPVVEHSSTGRFVFGVNLDDPRDVEDDDHVLVPVAKFAILAMICLMSFAIRLFAVVRYESVGSFFLSLSLSRSFFFFDFCLSLFFDFFA